MSRDKSNGIQEFWQELAENHTLLRQIAVQLEGTPEILNLGAEQQLMLLFAKADFCSSPDERVYVVRIFRDRLFDLDILPQVTEHQGLHLASKCLVSLGLFEGYMWHRTNRHGAPSPDFYRQIGKAQFARYGRFDVSRNFDDWTDYIKASFLQK